MLDKTVQALAYDCLVDFQRRSPVHGRQVFDLEVFGKGDLQILGVVQTVNQKRPYFFIGREKHF